MAQYKPRSVRVKHAKRRQRGGASVPCPQCGGDTTVVFTRRHVPEQTADMPVYVRRQRVCAKGHKFTTTETTTTTEDAVT